jgi:CubicO group peptidase (beta-lactamase class C family)
LERRLERFRQRYGLPGVAAAVVRGTRGIITGVAGVRRWQGESAIQLEDRLHIASCTKAWTATLAAIAVRKGQLVMPDAARRSKCSRSMRHGSFPDVCGRQAHPLLDWRPRQVRGRVRAVIVPEPDVAVVIASNSGDAGSGTRELWPELVESFATG